MKSVAKRKGGKGEGRRSRFPSATSRLISKRGGKERGRRSGGGKEGDVGALIWAFFAWELFNFSEGSRRGGKKRRGCVGKRNLAIRFLSYIYLGGRGREGRNHSFNISAHCRKGGEEIDRASRCFY